MIQVEVRYLFFQIAAYLYCIVLMEVVVCCYTSLFSFQVAVKYVSKKMQKKEQVAHEADVLLHVQNHQLVALLDTYESPSSLMLVLEL